MKARIPSHREFIINFPDSVDQAKANEGWAKLQQIVEDYKKAHNGASVYAPTFIEDCEPAVKKLQEEYGFNSTIAAGRSCSHPPAYVSLTFAQKKTASVSLHQRFFHGRGWITQAALLKTA